MNRLLQGEQRAFDAVGEPPLTVMLVDDGAEFRAVVGEFLSRLGYRAVTAADAESALALGAQTLPDIVLMDVVLPGKLDGIEATRRFKALAGARWLPVVILSAFGEDNTVLAGFDAGADDYLTKPLNYTTFSKRLATIARTLRALRLAEATLRQNQAISDSITDSIVSVDRDGKVVAVNRPSLALFGVSDAQALIGRPLPLMFVDCDFEEGYARLLEVNGRQQEAYGSRADGTIFPLELTLTPVINDESGVRVGVARDITERKANEARLRESLDKLSLLYSSSELGLALCDMDGRFVQCNGSFAQMLGRTEEEVLGLTYWDITPPEYEEQEFEQLGQLARTGRIGPYEKEFVRPDGTRAQVLLHGSQVSDANGRQHTWNVVQDIAERKRIEREQREAAESLAAYRDEAEREIDLAKAMIEQQLRLDALRDPRLRYVVEPAARFSGDVVAAQRAPNGHLYVMLADATGHGLGAAIGVLPLLSVFYRLIPQCVSVQRLVWEINAEIKRVAPMGRFVAATIACIDEAVGSGEIWVGGTPEVLLVGEDGLLRQRFRSRQLPLGIVDSMPLVTQPEVFEWSEFAQLVMMSDGVVEAENAAGEAFGIARVEAALASAPPVERFDALRAAIAAFLGERAPFDDMSILITDCITTHIHKHDPHAA